MADRPLVHAVFFTLKDRARERVDALVEACRKYLPDHPGVIHFSAGPRAAVYQRPVNDQVFDVALVVVFEKQDDHDHYQQTEAHKAFIAEQSANWAQVRVFDAFG